MLNDRRVAKGPAQTKPFRPALAELRSRGTKTRDKSTPRPRLPAPRRRLGWLRPLAVATLLATLAAGTLWSPEHADRLTGLVATAQTAAAQGAIDAQRAWRRHLDHAAVEGALHDLERQNARLRLEVLALREADAERRRLAHMLQATGGWGLEGVGARVVAFGGGGRTTLRLDAGVERGVTPGLSVLGANGVVGQVVASGTGWSDVLGVTDPAHGMAGAIDGGPRGILRGTRTGLAMEQVLSRHEVALGAPITTTGASGVFPPGIPIGSVAAVRTDPGTPFWRIDVTPSAPPDLLAEVLVVTGRTDRPEIAWR